MAQTLTGHYIYRHRKAGFPCKIAKRVEAAEVLTNRDTYMLRGFVLRVCECGMTQQGERVSGKFSERETCGAKCRSSKGPSCECSCSGENHGANY